MKVSVIGNALVIEGNITREDAKLLKMYNPDALKAFGGEDGKDELFSLVVDPGHDEFGRYAAYFGGTTHDDKKHITLTVRLSVPDDCADVTTTVADVMGKQLELLKSIVDRLPEAVKAVRETRAAIAGMISVG